MAEKHVAPFLVQPEYRGAVGHGAEKAEIFAEK